MPHTSVAGADSFAQDLLGGHVLLRAGALSAPTRRSGDAEVQDLRQSALGDDVRRLEVQVQDAVAVEVVDGRAQVQPEVDDVRERQPPIACVYDVREGLAGERLQDQGGIRLLDGLVEPHDVRVRELSKEPSFAQETAARLRDLQEILPRRFGDAAAGPLLAEDFVDVEVVALVQVLDYLVAGGEDASRREWRVIQSVLVMDFPHGSTVCAAAWCMS